MLTMSPEGMKLVPKGKRKGHELTSKDLISGQAALAVALNASLEQCAANCHASHSLWSLHILQVVAE